MLAFARSRLKGSPAVLQATRLLTRRTPKILMYHRFCERPNGIRMDVGTFERHLQYLRARAYRVMTLRDLCERLAANEVPPNAVVLTIDDGYEDFRQLAFPLLEKYGFPATLFVTTDFVDG